MGLQPELSCPPGPPPGEEGPVTVLVTRTMTVIVIAATSAIATSSRPYGARRDAVDGDWVSVVVVMDLPWPGTTRR